MTAVSSEAAVRTETRLADGTRIAVQVHGEGDEATPTVVLAHGWCLGHETWDPVVAELRRRRPWLRVVTYDQPGHGGSDLLPTSALQIRDLGDVMAAVVADHAARGPLLLGGHSMGGMTIMGLAARHREVLSRARGLLLVSTAGRWDPRRRGLPGEATIMGLFARAPQSWPGLPSRPGLAARNLFGADPDPEAVAATCALTSAAGARVTGVCYQALSRHDELATLAALEVPAAVLTGSRDRLTPVRQGREVGAHLRHGTFWSVPAAGHMLTYEATDVVVDRLERLLDEGSHR